MVTDILKNMKPRYEKKGWVDVYPIGDRFTHIKFNGLGFGLNSKLANFVEEQWEPKAEKGWKSSWVPFASRFQFEEDSVDVSSGVMPFHHISGINQAMEEGKEFSQEIGYIPCLSVGFVTATSDGKIIFQRRAPDVHCPNILIHEPCGYMSSLSFAERSECDKPEYASDPRLFSLEHQLEARARDITSQFGLERGQLEYRSTQDLLGAGWLSNELYFSTTGKLSVPEKDLVIPEGDFRFVPLEDVKELIQNQGKLSQVDIQTYKPDKTTEIPLIDESIVGLIWGYESLTGEKLDIEGTVDRLNREGLDLNVYDTSSGKSYDSFWHASWQKEK